MSEVNWTVRRSKTLATMARLDNKVDNLNEDQVRKYEDLSSVINGTVPRDNLSYSFICL
jgi:hypothetical protein